MGDERFNQWRIGGHVTAVKDENMRIAVGAGYADDSDNGPGAYGSIEAGIEF